MLEDMLLFNALSTGKLQFDKTPTHFRLYTFAFGTKITLALVSKDQVLKLAKPEEVVDDNRTIVGNEYKSPDFHPHQPY